MTNRNKNVILLAEDDPGDRELTTRALRKLLPQVDLRMTSDGQETIDYLLRRGCYASPLDSPIPSLLLLDLNMPRKDGIQVLEEIKGTEKLRGLPVVILTTSSRDADIARCYDLNCNSYIVKPVELTEFAEIVRHLGNYWFNLVTLPDFEAHER